METRYLPDPRRFATLTTAELRQAFLVEALFAPGELRMVYVDVDRAIVGAAAPTREPLALGTSKELASQYFAERREVGVINIGAAGAVTVDGEAHVLERRDGLYIGRGSRDIHFESADAMAPALFYFVSYPAHAAYPTRRLTMADAGDVKLGTEADANVRTIHKYIHPGGAQSCQLVMGLTELEVGSVWNTMPPHTHERRSEVYLYFDIDDDALVFHFMGAPEETRHVVVRNRQVVLSPSWSIHCGVGTRRYSFIWAMGGEKQDFDDMDPAGISRLM